MEALGSEKMKGNGNILPKNGHFKNNLLRSADVEVRTSLHQRPQCNVSELMVQRTVTKDSLGILPKIAFYHVKKSYYGKERMQVKIAEH